MAGKPRKAREQRKQDGKRPRGAPKAPAARPAKAPTAPPSRPNEGLAWMARQLAWAERLGR